MNTTRIAPRAVAFAFALLVTMVTLAGMDRLATSEHAAVQLAKAQATQANA